MSESHSNLEPNKKRLLIDQQNKQSIVKSTIQLVIAKDKYKSNMLLETLNNFDIVVRYTSTSGHLFLMQQQLK